MTNINKNSVDVQGMTPDIRTIIALNKEVIRLHQLKINIGVVILSLNSIILAIHFLL